MRLEQQEYCNQCEKQAKRGKPSTAEASVFGDWYRQQVDLKQDADGFNVNSRLIWCCIWKYGATITPEYLDSVKNSAELQYLLERAPHVATQDERAQAEAWLAEHEPTWREHYEMTTDERGGGVHREIVSYNSVQNLDKMVAALSDPLQPDTYTGGEVNGEFLLLAFKKLLAKGELTPIRRADRPTHNPPAQAGDHRSATHNSGAEKSQQGQKQRDDFQAQERLEADFYKDLKTVMGHFEYSSLGGGRPAWGATYSVRKTGLEQIRKKYDGQFTGAVLATYEAKISTAERENEHLNPSGGAVSGQGHDPREARSGGDPRVFIGGGSI